MIDLNGIPVYNATMCDEATGMLRISLVDSPAVLSDFMAFANVVPQMYAIADESAHVVRGCVMRANFPIYRRDGMGEYYIVYKPEVIRSMAEKYLKENRQNVVNLMHEGADVDGVQMVQYFIKDTAAGVCPSGFDDISDGSLFAEFHITNAEVWDAVKAGTYRGFSLEGVFGIEAEESEEAKDIYDELQGLFSKISKNYSISMSKLSKIIKSVAASVARVEFASTTTDKGVIYWDGEGELAEGMEVFGMDDSGERVAIEDGEYIRENDTIVVKDGKVESISENKVEEAIEEGGDTTESEGAEIEAEEMPELDEEVVEEAPAEPEGDVVNLDDVKEAIAEIYEIVEGVKKDVADVRAMIDEIKAQPLAESVEESYRTQRKNIDEQLARAVEIAKGSRR